MEPTVSSVKNMTRSWFQLCCLALRDGPSYAERVPFRVVPIDLDIPR